jgi:hypothetical protein
VPAVVFGVFVAGVLLTAFCCRSWRFLIKPFEYKMAFTPQDLLSEDEGRYNMAWSAFFLNKDHVQRFLREANEDEVKHTLAAGVRWSGGGWNTTRAAKELRAISGISLVSASWLEYQMSFLFSLALVRGIEVVQLELSERAGECAFRLAEVWGELLAADAEAMQEKKGKQKAVAGSSAMLVEDEEEDENGEEEAGGERLPWQDEPSPLNHDLIACLKQTAGGAKLPWKQILAELPLYQGLKQRAEDNNHGADGRSQGDKLLKGIQQKLLHFMRMLATIYTQLEQVPEDFRILGQQLFFGMSELEQNVLRERKRRSIPGAIPTTANGLFTKEDLAVEKAQQQLNQAGTPPPFQKREMWCFPTPPGSRPWKFKGGAKGFKGFSKGGGRGGYAYGYGSQWRGKGYGTQIPTPSLPLSSSPGSREQAGASNDGAKAANPSDEVKAAGHSKGQRRASQGTASCIIAHTGGSEPNPFNAVRIRQSSVIPSGQGRGEMGISSSVREIESLSAMVAKTCSPTCGGYNNKGGGGRFPSTRKAVSKCSAKNPPGDQSGHIHSGRLSKVRSLQKSLGCRKFRTFDPLVCPIQVRGGQHKTSSDCRLQGAQSVLHPRKIHLGKHPGHLPVAQKKLVCCKTGLKRCLFPSRTAEKFQKVHKNASGGSIVGVPSGMFWDEHPPQNIYVTNACAAKTVAIQGINGVRLFGRHHINWFQRKFGQKTTAFHGRNLVCCRFSNQPEKVNSGTLSKVATPGVYHRLSKRSDRGTPPPS